MRAKGAVPGDGSAVRSMDIPVPPGVDPEVLDVVPVPAGLWARTPGGAAAASDDPGFAALPHPDGMMTLIVGAPGDPVPGAAEIAGLLAALPSAWWEKVVVSRYGSEPGGGFCLPRQLAEYTGREIIALHGLLLAGVDGPPRITAVDADRGMWWQPFAEQSVYSPAGPSTLVRWNGPAPGLDELGAGGYRLVDGWFVQVVPAGLVLRREGWPVDPAADGASFDPGRLELVIDHPVAELTDGVLTALGRLADALPGPARVRLRVVLPDGTADAAALRLRWAVPAPQHRRSGWGTDALGPEAVLSDLGTSDPASSEPAMADAVTPDLTVPLDVGLPPDVGLTPDSQWPNGEHKWPERWSDGELLADDPSAGEWPDDEWSDGANADDRPDAHGPQSAVRWPPEEPVDLIHLEPSSHPEPSFHPGSSRVPATLLVITAQGRMCLV